MGLNINSQMSVRGFGTKPTIDKAGENEGNTFCTEEMEFTG